MVAKGNATAYSDYYKNNGSDSTPDGSVDSEDDTSTKDPGDRLRKKALQRRLKLMKMKES